MPGTGCVRHGGAIIGDEITYVDGDYQNASGRNPKYVACSECLMGKIPNSKKSDITKIEWTKLPPHPGNARYRIAAGAGPLEKKAGRIYFSGGTDTPYNYNGIGYDGQPAEPSPVTFAFNVHTREWETVSEHHPQPT